MMNGIGRRARRALAAVLAAVLALSLPALAGAEAVREIRCRQNLPGCRLLQMAAAGCFEAGEPEDAVAERVLAAAYSRLCRVTEEDVGHYCEEFGEEEDAARLCWYGALANCLRAKLAREARPSPVRQVLALFLDPPGSQEAQDERDEIRGQLNDGVLARIADDIGAPAEFVRWLMEDGLSPE